jgi:hypothetical protein
MLNESPAEKAREVPLIRARDDTHASRAARSGELAPVLRGVYAAATAWRALTPWDRYANRVAASVFTHPDEVRFLESAASIHGLPIFGDPGTVHLLGGPAARTRSTIGVQLHVTSEPRQLEVRAGVPVTSLADTVVDVARARHNAIGLAVADAALRLDPSLTVEQLVARNEARASSRGRRHARWALTRASSVPETPLESIDRAVIEWLGFPEPELQVWIGRGSERDRVDKWWPDHRIAGEGDGDLKYDGRFGDPAAVLRERHRRDARLFRNGVRAVPHWGWPEAVSADPLQAILASAGLPVIRPRDARQLFPLPRVLGPSH